MTILAAMTPVYVTLETTRGTIRLELDAKRAPKTVANFLSYVDSAHFDGLVFHRVIPGFMIQGGGLDAELRPRRTREPIVNEAANGLRNVRGSIAMARTYEVDSATSQFFINVADNGFLDHGARDFGYAVFGRVVGGMEVVDEIARTPTGTRRGHTDVPLEPIVMLKATRS